MDLWIDGLMRWLMGWFMRWLMGWFMRCLTDEVVDGVVHEVFD